MPQLLKLQDKDKSINIVEAIGNQWRVVGIVLLNDERGAIVDSIADEFRGNARNINLEILKHWLRGEGMSDRSWRGLLGVLREHCGALADRVEEVLTAEEDEQGKCTVANSLKLGCGSSQNGSQNSFVSNSGVWRGR